MNTNWINSFVALPGMGVGWLWGFCALVFIAAVLVFLRSFSKGKQTNKGSRLDILRNRYLKREISKGEFLEALKEL